MRTQTLAMRVLLIALLPLHLPAQAAGCASDEVQTGEDADNIYCTKKTEIACIRQVGEQSSSKQTQVRCAKRVEQVAKSYGYKLTGGATTCLSSCGAAYMKRGEPISTLACVTTCSLTGILATEVLDKVVEEQNSCFEDALAQQKKDIEDCKK